MKQKTNILTKKGFFDRHLELLPESDNGRDAYNKVCDEVQDKFKVKPRYSSYESFKSAKSYWYKSRK